MNMSGKWQIMRQRRLSCRCTVKICALQLLFHIIFQSLMSAIHSCCHKIANVTGKTDKIWSTKMYSHELLYLKNDETAKFDYNDGQLSYNLPNLMTFSYHSEHCINALQHEHISIYVKTSINTLTY